MTFFTNLPSTGNLLLHSVFGEETFSFQLFGYTQADLDELTDMGFEDIRFETREPTGYLKNLEHIWWYKLRAAAKGKDIWNAEIDNYLMILLFCRIIFAVIGILLWIIMLNSISNSFQMKLSERERFIQLLHRLGCARKTIFGIYFVYFVIRALAVFAAAALLAGSIMYLLNDYMDRVMYLKVGMPVFPAILIAVMIVIQLVLMKLVMRKAWRESNEEE